MRGRSNEQGPEMFLDAKFEAYISRDGLNFSTPKGVQCSAVLVYFLDPFSKKATSNLA